MLNPHASQGPASRQRRFGTVDERFHDLLTVERLRRHEEAERIARIGLFEISVSIDGGHESQHWSAGIYAILRRDPLTSPLQRTAYVTQYVHPEDQQRVLGSSLDALEHGREVGMTYRIVCDDGSVSEVSEHLAVVTTTATERLLFSDLKEIPSSGPGALLRPATRDPEQPSVGEIHAVPGLQGLVATFDALREREQKRLAREMHDDFGQLLAAMKLDLCMLKKKLVQGDSTGLSEVQNLQEMVDAMMTSVRRIIAELPPKAVDELGLFPALEQLVAGFRKRHAFRLTMRLSPSSTRLDPGVELAVYRVLQEALNNIVRHAGATVVDISVECNRTHLMLQIRDDGKGIDLADLGKSGSFGLQWMRERVLALAGTFDLGRAGAHGTCISISLPLQQTITAHDA